jgi:putative IMPACT (imprinted ancient) family translation regulator
VLVVEVRYFGGNLLGIPGLINAYKSAAAMALQMVPIIQCAVLENYSLHFNYTAMNDVMLIVKQYNCSIIQQDTQLFCYMQLGLPKVGKNEVLFKLNDLQGVEITAL